MIAKKDVQYKWGTDMDLQIEPTVHVLTPLDMDPLPQELLDKLITQVQRILMQKQKGLDYYCVDIPKPKWYYEKLGSALVHAYKAAGWHACECANSVGCPTPRLVIELWRVSTWGIGGRILKS